MQSAYRVPFFAGIVLTSSALLMSLELVAARLIAPYVGVSLYTWTSIIGVILAGLSLGNWLGGVWADRGAGNRVIGMVLGASGVTCLAILWGLTVIAPWLQQRELSLLGASFIYVIILFFVPVLLIGIITPVLTTLALRGHTQPGHIVGLMNATAALGSIAGTFLTGYWLIQFIGTRLIIVGISVLLLLMALPFLVSSKAIRDIVLLVVLTGFVLGLTITRDGLTNPCDKESQYFCIRVVNADKDVPTGKARALVLDHLVHGINHETFPEMLVSPYVHAMDEITRLHISQLQNDRRYFFAGGGSYTQPRAVTYLDKHAEMTVAELDPWVTRIAREKLFVKTENMRIVHMDARMALGKEPDGYFSAIVGDVFHDVTVPFHLTTREYAALIKRKLINGGIYVLNIVDVYPDPRLVKSIYKTLKSEYAHVHIWLRSLPARPRRVTYVLSASDTDVLPKELEAQKGFRRSWRQVTAEITAKDTPVDSLPLLTDDFVPVEHLVAGLITGNLGTN